MSFSHRQSAARRAVVSLGVLAALAALTTGGCGATAAEPLPPPVPPPGAPPVPVAAPAEPWDSIARCETGGDWYADTGNGYQGGLQLSPRTWAAHGGGEFAPRADDASREQQIVVGERVRADQGWAAWSGCADDLRPR
jgi:hypothetical protein